MTIRRAVEPMGEWGLRAARLYSEDYATRYRDADRAATADEVFVRLSAWLADLCAGFGRPISILDLGCGTGRYFSALNHVEALVGIDASESMLEHARAAATVLPAGTPVTLIRGDLGTCSFEAGRFDLVYAVGVLAEHAPLTADLTGRISSWLAPGGAFAFTAVHPESFSVPQSWKRRVGRRAMALASGAVRDRLRSRWLAGGLYADESSVTDQLRGAGFEVASLDLLVDVHLHCLAVGRKPAAL
jgi:SAM-dependent methyltransferase